MSIQASRTVAGIILLGIVGAAFWYMKRDTNYVSITSFEECVRAGYASPSSVECKTPDGRFFVPATSTIPVATSSAPDTAKASSSPPIGNENLIRVTNVTPGQKITSPLVVRGEARGNWYFEASFPVRLLDGNGAIIVQMPAQAIGEWMTSEFVPFTVSLTFAKPSTATGTLLLHNDNPSGLPENDRWISVPVRF